MTERIQLLDDLGAEFARVAAKAEQAERARDRQSPRRRSGSGSRVRMAAVALGAAALLGSAAYAVPATRTAVDGIAGSFAGWVSGDGGEAPGRPVETRDNAPAWFADGGGEARLIAMTEGLGLYARTTESDQGPWLEFWLGEARGMGDTLESWEQRLAQQAVVVLGYTPFGPRNALDERGRAPLFGLTAREVQRVELRYTEGPSLVVDAGDGGFVLLADAWRPLRELMAYDASGRELGRADLTGQDLRYLCEKDSGCPQSALSRRSR